MKRSLRAALLRLSLAAATALAAAPALAESDPSRVAQASDFFDAGAAAYKAGQYLVAAEAFLRANEIAPSPSLLFSAAQAYRRQYLAEPSPGHLRRAIGLYRDYLRIDKTAKRREDAVHALEALVPLEARHAGAAEADGAPSEPARTTRLLLSSPVDGAEVSVDGGPFVRAPVVAKVPPGPHQVRVRAPGHFEEQLTAQAVEGELIPRPVALRPKPARLRVVGVPGARVSVDGMVRAELPLSAPIEVDPGPHFVAVTLTGHEPFSKKIEAERDATIDLAARLPQTRQRIAAFGVLSLGAAGAVATGVLTGLMLSQQGTAVSLRDQQEKAPLTPDERDRYNAAVTARDGFGRAAALTGAASAILLGTGAGLFALDRPEAAPPSDDRRRAPQGPAPRADFDVGLLSFRVRVSF